MTRDGDINVAGADRAATAASHRADLYLSLHFNGSEHANARGTEAFIDRTYKLGKKNADGTTQEGPGLPESGLKNINVAEDAAFAHQVVQAAVSALKLFDNHSVLRSDSYSPTHGGATYKPPPGVKMKSLATLADLQLQNDQTLCRACLLELEFMDHAVVESLYISGVGAEEVRNAVAAAIAMALVEAL
jgi:N-acetylmuramoyl-L-alanine amidase